jgi:hypothetical protein
VESKKIRLAAACLNDMKQFLNVNSLCMQVDKAKDLILQYLKLF